MKDHECNIMPEYDSPFIKIKQIPLFIDKIRLKKALENNYKVKVKFIDSLIIDKDNGSFKICPKLELENVEQKRYLFELYRAGHLKINHRNVCIISIDPHGQTLQSPSIPISPASIPSPTPIEQSQASQIPASIPSVPSPPSIPIVDIQPSQPSMHEPPPKNSHLQNNNDKALQSSSMPFVTSQAPQASILSPSTIPIVPVQSMVSSSPSKTIMAPTPLPPSPPKRCHAYYKPNKPKKSSFMEDDVQLSMPTNVEFVNKFTVFGVEGGDRLELTIKDIVYEKVNNQNDELLLDDDDDINVNESGSWSFQLCVEKISDTHLTDCDEIIPMIRVKCNKISLSKQYKTAKMIFFQNLNEQHSKLSKYIFENDINNESQCIDDLEIEFIHNIELMYVSPSFGRNEQEIDIFYKRLKERGLVFVGDDLNLIFLKISPNSIDIRSLFHREIVINALLIKIK